MLQFSGNMENKESKFEREIGTMVKGIELRITDGMIADLLGIPNDGHRFAMVQDIMITHGGLGMLCEIVG